ncbi:MAG: glycosyltransferase family 4 protein [Natronomonas sp.]|uniref:glycosyltransferase family 4 protein n=1 Tax=Natronomonas sp. TaxID=2184060 RepID=UPI0028708C6B|nr:glycosyltransferase family 4 protein [Natronomonas sp.]MDR9381105.1 glycosyltransferase family 4 protein [Natronomonas sp.]MDR9429455.1 glycosyltransferase family 4 protein [Natronomonas sp.]
MRVGLTLYGDIDERSGGFRYDRKLLEGLRAAGDTVELVELPWRRYPRGLLDNASPRLRDRLDVDVDVMLQDELAHPSLLRANRQLPYPIVSIVHHLRASESRRLSPFYRAIERRYLGTVDGAVCNSTTTRDIVTGLGVDPGLTAVAPPAGDQFDPDLDDGTIEHRARERPLRIVFVGNVTPRKGLKTLIEGLSAAETDVKLTVVGRSADERYAAAVRRSVRREGLADRVDLAGELSEEELETVLRSSHVLAVPSRYEGFGIVYLEGMSFGLPAIASRAGGATDVVTDGETGVLVDPGNSAAIAGALTRFDADRDRLASMGKAARRRYESHPDWRETTARVRELLEAVAALEVIP